MPSKVVILSYASSVHTIRWIKALSERGFDIHNISLGGEPVDGIETTIIPYGRLRRAAYFTNAGKVKRLIEKISPALVHAHYATGYGLWGYRAGKHPYLLTVWGSDIINFPNNSIKKFLLRKLLNSADLLTATSKFLLDKTVSIAPKIKDRIKIVPFGVQPPDKVQDYGDSHTTRLVFAKMHHAIYGPDILLRTVHGVRSRGGNITLSMAGEGPMTESLKTLARDLQIEDIVTFDGFIPNDEIFEYIGRHDIMVMPSVVEESFGVAALEAAACGLPVIASDTGGIPEAVINGETGYLVPPGNVESLADAILHLAQDKDLRSKMGRAGREFVKNHYLWDNCADKMAQLYDRLISRGR